MKKNAALYALSIAMCVACGILACAAQTSFLPKFFDDAYLVLDLLLCLSVALGACKGPAFGAFFGIYAGILADSANGFGISLLPLFYMLCGYLAFVVCELIPKNKFILYCATCVLCILGRAVVSVIYVMLSMGSVPLLDVARYVCLPIILGTLIVMPLAYPVGLLLTLPVRFIQKQTIDKII